MKISYIESTGVFFFHFEFFDKQIGLDERISTQKCFWTNASTGQIFDDEVYLTPPIFMGLIQEQWGWCVEDVFEALRSLLESEK